MVRKRSARGVLNSRQKLTDEERYDLLKEYEQRVGFKKDDPRWKRLATFAERTGHFEDAIDAYIYLEDVGKLKWFVKEMDRVKRLDLSGKAWDAVEKKLSENELRDFAQYFMEKSRYGRAAEIYNDLLIEQGARSFSEGDVKNLADAYERLGHIKEAKDLRRNGLSTYMFGSKDRPTERAFAAHCRDLHEEIIEKGKTIPGYRKQKRPLS